jgi:hypothetical protein
MPLNPVELASALKSAASDINPGDYPDIEAYRDALFLRQAQAICLHIQTHAQVIVTSVAGVTTGPGVSGPGTGTII